jgi:hypothetical protein
VTRLVPVVVVAVLVFAAPRAAAAELPPAPPATIVAPLDPPDPGAAPPPAVTAVPETAPVAPPPAGPSAADEALRRVLRSSCRDGLDDVRAHRNDPETPWALTVTRLCNDILIEKMEKRSVTGGNEGRGRLVLWSTLYGIWLGIATDIMFEVDGDRAVIVAPLVGMGAGLGLSLAATSNFHLTVGEAYTIITGLDYGSFNGALWAGGLDLSDKGVVGATVATSIAATSIGVLVANAKSPSAGDIELVRSGLLWGTIGGVLTTAAIGPSITNDISTQSVLKLAAAAMDAGFVTGVALANTYDLSKNRVLLIDAGGFTGGLAGAGIAWLVAGSDSNGQGIAGAGLAGMLAGIGVAAYVTRDLDEDDAESIVGARSSRSSPSSRSSVQAVFARDNDGRWSVGTPGPVPVLDGTGTRLLGATFNAVGGQF